MLADNPPPPGGNLNAGPQPGPQPDAIYCPLCTAHLRAVESRQYPPEIAHRYECEHGHYWEINRLPEREVDRNWNGARPNWANGLA